MRLKTLVLCTTSLGVLAFSATPTFAQTQPQDGDPGTPAATPPQTTPAPGVDNTDAADNGQDIIVTGIRASLQSAQNIRRNSTQIIDSVVAEDIGKLPDLNTAETAARIPGVQVYRQGGEASNVLVRGLPFFTTTYNGREIFTAETRVVALQDFPSANIAALEVYKTSTADLVEPGLAGLVNVRSRRPFDFTGAQFAGSVWELYTRQGNSVRPNFNLLATDRWQTGIGEIGFLINASYDQMKYLDSEISNTDFIADPTVPPSGQHVRLPDIQRLYYRSGRRERPSVNAALQWRPSSSLEVYGEFLWQGFRNQIDDHFLESPLYGGAAYSNLVLRDGTNQVSSGTVTNPGGNLFSYQGGTYNRTDTFQYAGGLKFNQDRWHISADVARTRSTFRGSTESIDRIFPGARTINFNLEDPSFTVTGINFTDPTAQTFQGLYEEDQRAIGRDWQLRADLQYDFDTSFLRNIQIGVRYTDRKAERDFGSRYAYLLPLGLNASTLPVTFDVFRGVEGSNGTYNWTAPTYDSIRDNLVQLRQYVISHCAAILPTDPGNGCASYTTTPLVAGTQFRANETTLAGYGQLNLGGDALGGVIGLRVNRIRTTFPGPPTGIPAVDNGNEHTEFLPNASLRWRVDPKVQVRLAVSKTETRPDFAQLEPFVTINSQGNGPAVGTDQQPRTGQGGNPFLQPYTSWNYDAALEFYFSRAGFASVTGFRRDLNGFILNRTYRFTDPTLGVVQISGPINTGKGYINGVEFQAQTFLDFGGLPRWLHGFGVQGNVTYLDAKLQQDNGAGGLAYLPITDELNGTSKWNWAVVGMYESGGLSARLTYSGRSSFLGTRQYRGDDVYIETSHPADRLDLSLNYELLKRFTIFADWTNITHSKFRQDFSSARAGATRAEYPRYVRFDEETVSLGIRFRFGK
ncbi:TonB-dependent receptor [Sphingomonas sp.]|jgi:TonB-dependent receptor|uniref:TonB-dependent receptor n=1 Tax=Sphingomonas sp. TaxID=28214 RepID=UPI002E33C4DB|nr:TonB-dependent receptor [Sphingomonas sp.]HEX4694670.1 TonB-dependent receptor [Sphingomonas sp.]